MQPVVEVDLVDQVPILSLPRLVAPEELALDAVPHALDGQVFQLLPHAIPQPLERLAVFVVRLKSLVVRLSAFARGCRRGLHDAAGRVGLQEGARAGRCRFFRWHKLTLSDPQFIFDVFQPGVENALDTQ